MLALTAMGLPSCYTYVPATLDSIPVGTEVRALVSTEGQVRLLHEFGIDSRSIAGKLEAGDDQRVRVAVRAVYAPSTPGIPALYQRVELAPRDLLRLEMRRLDRFKTGGLLALLAATAGTTVILAATGTFEGGSPPPPGGGPPGR